MSALRNKMIQQMELKGYSKNTISTYIDCLSSLSKHYKTSPDLLSIDQIREYFHYKLTVEKLSKSWVNQTIGALKILYCEVLRRDWDDLAIPRPRREKKLPVVLSKDEISRIINTTKNVKHKALLMITYSSGLRLGEVCNLRPGDIDSERMMVRVVQAKGAKDRYTILSPVTLAFLRDYWKIYRVKNFLFENSDHEPLAHKTVQSAFKKALQKSGVKKDVGIHSLRHSFATHLMEQGVSLPIIQQLLGHTSLRTTSIYLHVQQYSVFAVKSPLDTLSL